ncbi:MAG: GTP pyrophosphokinase [Pseudanabaenaceae cyanobacterium]|jgi:guanosine-3',5'-bis(diphosphate) 3'-pyrophosphohydrolase
MMVQLNYETLLATAITIATQAHEGQTDKAGQPYIQHPLAVMARVDSPEAKIVAVLHDSLEDSNLVAQDLVDAGFTPEIVAAVQAITKRPGESYEEYLDRVMSNPLAMTVKIADVSHNMDITRIANPTDADYQRLARYEVVLQRLQAAQQWQLGRSVY